MLLYVTYKPNCTFIIPSPTQQPLPQELDQLIIFPPVALNKLFYTPNKSWEFFLDREIWWPLTRPPSGFGLLHWTVEPKRKRWRRPCCNWNGPGRWNRHGLPRASFRSPRVQEGQLERGGEENQGKKDLILICSDVCFYVKILIYYDFDKDKLYIINNSVSIRFRHFKLNLFTCQPMFKKTLWIQWWKICLFFFARASGSVSRDVSWEGLMGLENRSGDNVGYHGTLCNHIARQYNIMSHSII